MAIGRSVGHGPCITSGIAGEPRSALFFEDDVLANHRIVLLDLDALAGIGLVLSGHVRVARARGRTQFDDGTLIAGHDESSNLLARGPHIDHYPLDAAFVDGLDALGANAEGDPTTLAIEIKTLLLDVGVPASTRAAVRV